MIVKLRTMSKEYRTLLSLNARMDLSPKDKLNGIPSKLTNRHKMLSDQLISLHQTDSPYTRFPSYSYGQLQKGPLCADFQSLILVLLFPDLKITTNLVHDWCRVVGSRKTIRRILMQNYKSVGERQHRYFE
ncbi:hypothetical protein AB7942_24505 [Neobacillus sp. BF23-41]|uniref:hypothetical protein n=1 Tax=Neobacillus sp. BF23-41 TaxID=3240280 RepID=UPI0034E59F4A